MAAVSEQTQNTSMRAYVPMREDTRPYITESVWSSSAERVGAEVRERGVYAPGRRTHEDGPLHIPAGEVCELPVFRVPAVDWRDACPTGVCTTEPQEVDRGRGPETCRVPAGLYADTGRWTRCAEPATQAVERCSTHRGEWIRMAHDNPHPGRRVRAEAVETKGLSGMPPCLVGDDKGRAGARTLAPRRAGEAAYANSTAFCLTYSFTSSQVPSRPPALAVHAFLASRRAVAERGEVDVKLISASPAERGVRYVMRAEVRSLVAHGDTTDDMAWIVGHTVWTDEDGGEWALEYTALSGVVADKG